MSRHVGGHQIGSELDARETSVECFRQCPDQQSLAETGHALDQHMTAGQQRDEDLIDDSALSDECLRAFRTDGTDRTQCLTADIRDWSFIHLDPSLVWRRD